MSRQLIPFHAADISALARSLKSELAKLGQPPGHVELLNVLARGAGFRNFQHLRAQWAARERLENPPAPRPEPVVDFERVVRATRYFDAAGRLLRWPPKHSDRQLCLWVLWSRIEARRVFVERDINLALQSQHLFGDHALLRRELCDQGLMTRTADGRAYRRLERAPPAEARALIRHLSALRAA